MDTAKAVKFTDDNLGHDYVAGRVLLRWQRWFIEEAVSRVAIIITDVVG